MSLNDDSTLTGRNHPSTSFYAAQNTLGRSGNKRELVFKHLTVKPRTDDELQRDIPMGPNTERPRRVELVDLGLIEDSGVRRLTRDGSEAIVWAPTDRGWEVARQVFGAARPIPTPDTEPLF